MQAWRDPASHCRIPGQLLCEGINFGKEFIVLVIGFGGLDRLDVEGAVRFQDALSYLVKVFEALAVDDLQEFFVGGHVVSIAGGGMDEGVQERSRTLMRQCRVPPLVQTGEQSNGWTA